MAEDTQPFENSDKDRSKSRWELVPDGKDFSLFFHKLDTRGVLLIDTRSILNISQKDVQELYEFLRDTLKEKGETTPLEIERKFLLASLPNASPDYIIAIQQYYMPEKGRVRESHITDCHTKARVIEYHKTMKTLLSPGVFAENEQQITEAEYLELRALCPTGLKKVRHVYKRSDGLKWEVDVYDRNLVIAEIEIPTVDYIVEIERYITEQLITEVTGRPDYYNSALATPSRHYAETTEYTQKQMQESFDGKW